MAAQSHGLQAASEAKLDYFPFLKLPLEIRNMIYVLMLAPGMCHMCPDPTRLNERNQGDHYRYRIDDGIRLIRTCKQICHEATSTLYGRNVFHFVESFCPLEEDEPGPGRWCELDSLPIWLRYIGIQNVLKIRTLRICVCGLGAGFAPGESDLPSGVSPVGEALIHAFDYLSFGHNIHRLEFWFPYSEELGSQIQFERDHGFFPSPDEDSAMFGCQDGKAYANFFRKTDTAVLKALRKVKGVREFIAPELHDVWPSETHVMRTIKAEVESQEPKVAQEKQSKMVKLIPQAGKSSKEEPKVSIRERLVVMEKERAENISLLGKLLGNLRKQGEDIGGLMKQVQDIQNTVG